jgi:hypothetical protein
MSERLKRDHEQETECESCCGNRFSTGDPITVRYPDDVNNEGIYISSSNERLIWRNITAGSVLENSSCVGLAIRERIPTP